MTRNPHLRSRTQGSTLIEVLVAILILSFGLLAIGSFLAYTVQLPKLSGNRSVAVVAGNDLIERMRSNPTASGSYVTTTYATATFTTGAAPPTSLPSGSTCSFPSCTTATMATMDLASVDFLLKNQLPSGTAGMRVEITTAPNIGRLWVVWQEPGNFGSFDTLSSDNCPADIRGMTITADSIPRPRCVYLTFRL